MDYKIHFQSLTKCFLNYSLSGSNGHEIFSGHSTANIPKLFLREAKPRGQILL